VCGEQAREPSALVGVSNLFYKGWRRETQYGGGRKQQALGALLALCLGGGILTASGLEAQRSRFAACVWQHGLLTKRRGICEGTPMEPAGSGLSLVVWQGWGVLSVMAVLTALLATILAWLLPFPERSLDSQLAHYDDRMALKDRLGGAPPFRTYLSTVRRFSDWLAEWFGPAFSGQAYERCLAIAFIFPITLFLITLMTNGLTARRISTPEVMLFVMAFSIIAYVIVAAFKNLIGLIEHGWKMFGGDQDLAQTIARVLLGGFAVMVAFTIAFAIATTFSGKVSNAGSVLGAMAGGFALAFAFAVAFALAGAALFSVAIAVLGGAALAFASQFAFLLFLFFILLPVVNASIDWLSWGATRFFLKLAETAEPDVLGELKVLGAVIGTFVSGAILMVVLTALLPNVIEGLNYAFSFANLPPFNWQALLTKAVNSPWTDGLFVTGMLMTAIVPASAHLTIGLAGVLARLTPGAKTAAESISDHPEAKLSTNEQGPVKLTLIFSRIWYLVAAGITVIIIAGASAIIYLTHAPVAEFLSHVAMCATAWSHGQCVWL
jgi:hypothetical protein